MPIPPSQSPRRAPQNLNPFSGAGGTMRYWDEAELKDLLARAGLASYERERSRMFIMLAARKPGGSGADAAA